jgi:NitT/TauT family transport system substrate-binding protein
MQLNRGDFVRCAGLASLGGVVSARSAAAADDLKPVRVLTVPSDGSKSVLYAQKANLFRKRGIQTDIAPMGSGAAIFAAVLGGSADIGAGNLFAVFAAYAHGIPLRIVAPIAIYTSEHADTFLLVRKDSAFRSARDLNGKILGTNDANDVSSLSTRAWIDSHGGDGKSLRMIELKATEQLASLDAGRIDCAVLKPPYLTVALESGKFRPLGKPLDAIAPRFLLSCFVATVDYIAKNPDIVGAFAAGLAEAARYTNANQAATVDLVAAFSGQDPAVLGHGVRSISAETIALSDVQRPLDFASKYGLVDKPFTASAVLASSMPTSRGR